MYQQFEPQLNAWANDGAFFLYDLDGLRTFAQTLINQSTAKLYFACKANPFSPIIRTLAAVGFNFDTASLGELNQVSGQKVDGQRILLTGPAKTLKLLKAAAEANVGTVVVESLNQLRDITTIINNSLWKPKILLRLQLQWASSDESVLGGSAITPFGMDIDSAKQALKETSLPVNGFHVFQWGNILEINRLEEIWNYTAKTCKTLLPELEVLDVGGGLGIPYRNETPLTWPDVLSVIEELKSTHHIPELWLELGRYLTGTFGLYFAQVVDVKTTYGKRMLVLNGGSHHLVRPALIKEDFPCFRLRPNNTNAQLVRFSIHGPLCTSLDCLGTHLLPDDTHNGDVIVFRQTGAYGFTESMPFFLCHDLPGEAVIDQNSIKMIRPIKGAESWLV